MRIVVALGGNALQRRGEPATVERQRANVATACRALAPLAMQHELVVTHGNGPQIGLLALQTSGSGAESDYPFDVLGAQTEGMIGYFIEQELGNLLPADKPIATILTMTEVDADDPAFDDPTKFVGPAMNERDARRIAAQRGWMVKPDGDSWRRVVASPVPRRIVEARPIEWLLAQGCVVVCAGGGGIPTTFVDDGHRLVGAEAVVDKDRASAVLARGIGADLLVIATDVDAVHLDHGTSAQRVITEIGPDELDALSFPAGSMGPKAEAAADFARTTGHPALIGSLDRLADVLAGRSGTRVTTAATGVVTVDPDPTT